MSLSNRRLEDAERTEFIRILTEATEEEKLAYLRTRARRRRIQDSLNYQITLPLAANERRSTLERRAGDRRRENVPVRVDRRKSEERRAEHDRRQQQDTDMRIRWQDNG